MLRPTHHGTIETVGARCQQNEDEQQVEGENATVVPPFSCSTRQSSLPLRIESTHLGRADERLGHH